MGLAVSGVTFPCDPRSVPSPTASLPMVSFVVCNVAGELGGIALSPTASFEGEISVSSAMKLSWLLLFLVVPSDDVDTNNGGGADRDAEMDEVLMPSSPIARRQRANYACGQRRTRRMTDRVQFDKISNMCEWDAGGAAFSATHWLGAMYLKVSFNMEVLAAEHNASSRRVFFLVALC